jgi:hypothetical protein
MCRSRRTPPRRGLWPPPDRPRTGNHNWGRLVLPAFGFPFISHCNNGKGQSLFPAGLEADTAGGDHIDAETLYRQPGPAQWPARYWWIASWSTRRRSAGFRNTKRSPRRRAIRGWGQETRSIDLTGNTAGGQAPSACSTCACCPTASVQNCSLRPMRPRLRRDFVLPGRDKAARCRHSGRSWRGSRIEPPRPPLTANGSTAPRRPNWCQPLSLGQRKELTRTFIHRIRNWCWATPYDSNGQGNHKTRRGHQS